MRALAAAAVFAASLRPMRPFLAANKDFVNAQVTPQLSPRVLTDFVAKKLARPLSYPITEEWRLRIRARMSDLKISQAELARAIGCKEPTLHHILRASGTQKTSLMAKMHDVLRLPPPGPPTAAPQPAPTSVDPVDAELADVIDRMDDEWKRKLLDIARNFPVKPRG